MISQEGGGAEESPREVLPPEPATTLAEFTPALRLLRTWAGLTYRQLEARAKEQGRALPSSTIATTLGRSTLPRESFVDAYTRACGLKEEQVQRWVDARARIAMGVEPEADEGAGGDTVVTAVPARVRSPWRWRAPVIVAVIIGLGLVLAVSFRGRPSGAPAQTSKSVATSSETAVPWLDISEVGSWAEIHPARTPKFCLAEGRDRTNQFTTAIAAQQPCGQTVSPRVFVDPVGEDNAVQIQWHHQGSGIGCLTVLNDGVGQDLLVPRKDCDDDNTNQLFTFEPIGPSGPDSGLIRIHPVGSGQCLGLRDQDTIAGTEIVQERCSGAPDQEFLINPIPPPA
ncbi:ricin-type beta-trefoil lectin protein [Lentzea atacamensis]|uniref:Ricin-type beta-trefoil lectin protein n=1 Tax=Lentzea atacamensis TaxID=531938 RepID=A0A316HWE5_9PSEU|nr:XRE family transcriptional regulator [Lentzea atacamensis]PWK85427.1 ricin-type beta-trefoil lectin protein [Lentzea atacamensis]